MASSSLTPYESSAGQQTFALVSTGENKTTHKVAGRDIATPYLVEVKRSFTNPSATGNDHVSIRIQRTERNATTGKLATMQVNCDISIPKDTSIIDGDEQVKLVSILSSLLNEETAMEATDANITALVEGRDL